MFPDQEIEAVGPSKSPSFDQIPSDLHQTIKVRNKQTKRVKLYFRCLYKGCGSIFNKSCNLRDHFCKHTGERPFKCELCDKKFS